MSIKDIAIKELERQKASSADSEAMHDLIRNIYAYRAYEAFSDIPDNMKTQEGAYNWLFMKRPVYPSPSNPTVYPSPSNPMRDYFLQIPHALVLDKTREIAVGADSRVLADIDPNDVKDYLDLFLKGYGNSHLAATYLHEDFRTAEAVEVMISAGMPEYFSKSHAENAWMSRVMTPELVDKASIASRFFMVSLPESQITDEALKSHLEVGYSGYLHLRDVGRLNLAGRYMKAGIWPRPLEILGDEYQCPPRDIDHALELAVEDRQDHRNRAYQSLYMAYVLSHPVGEVAPKLKVREYVSMALELYSEVELRPFMKTNRHLKAAMLEESLGL
jgi:hypothetical protein